MDSGGEAGFTLIELLIVMIIVGVLASIAFPVFMSQRAKAHDMTTRSDLSRLAKELTAYYVDGTGAPVLVYTAPAGGNTARFSVTNAAGTYTSDVVALSEGTVQPAANASRDLNDPVAWCVALTNPKGDARTFRYSAATGMDAGSC